MNEIQKSIYTVFNKDVTNLKALTTINYNNIERTIIKKFLNTFP